MKENLPELQKSRTLSDAEKIKGGAEYNKKLRLEFTAEQVGAARQMMEQDLMAQIDGEMERLKSDLNESMQAGNWSRVSQIAIALDELKKKLWAQKVETRKQRPASEEEKTLIGVIEEKQNKLEQLESDPELLQTVFEARKESLIRNGTIVTRPEDLLNFLRAELRVLRSSLGEQLQ